MIDTQTVQIAAVFLEAIGILLVRRSAVLYLALATILTIALFFLV